MKKEKRKIKVVHIPFSGRNPYQKLLADGLKRSGVDVKGASVSRWKNISFLNLSMFALLVEHWKPDIVHLHWQSSFLYVDGSRFKTILKALLFIFQLRVLKMLGIKIVWTVHNLKRHEETFRDIEARFTKKLAKMANKIIVHCQTAGDEVRRQFNFVGENQLSIIPHGHFIGYYPNQITRDEARKKLGLPPSKLTFLFLGEIRYYKGVMELIEAFKSLDDKDINLIVAGRPHNGKILHEIRQRTETVRNISTNLSYVPDDELQIYINASDVMVFPYRDIFTSGGIFLGISFGKPIIAPRTGCIADTLNGSPNFLYDVLMKDGLIKAMRAAIDSKNAIEKIGRYNLELAEQFSWRDIAESMCHAYRKSISG